MLQKGAIQRVPELEHRGRNKILSNDHAIPFRRVLTFRAFFGHRNRANILAAGCAVLPVALVIVER
jgi:hypothetical protein